MTGELALELYGVRIRITAPAELLDRIRDRLRYACELPPGGLDRPASGPGLHVGLELSISSLGGGKYLVARDGEDLLKATAEGAVTHLESQLRQQVSMRSPEMIFVHAGVVGFRGRAVVIPGESHSGKTTLVAALVRAGASYLSDEYAVLDAEGFAHPFVKPLSIRNANGEPRDHAVETLGGTAADAALPVGLVVLSEHKAHVAWQPTRPSDGDAILTLLRHTVQARVRPADSLAALKRVVEGATVLEGERGEAAELVPALLDELVSTLR